MAEASSHWLSILVTLLLRSDEEADRKPALLLLKNCAYSGPLNNKKTNIKLSKDGATRLIRLVFINFQHVKLIAEDMNGLDLSGLDLFGLKASMSNLSKIRFRWTCLNEANFERSKLDQVDFCGSSLCKASFKNSILDMCDISKVDFEEVDLSHVSFKKILLENVMNLEPEQMYSASSFQECSFSECLFRWTKDMIEFIERNGIKRLSSNIARVKVVSTPDQWYKDFIQKENVKIDRGSKNWPNESHNHNVKLNDEYEFLKEISDLVCFLDRDDSLFKLIEHFTHLTSDTLDYRSMRLEPARMLQSPDTIQFIKDELKGPPTHIAQISSITIKDIFLIKNTNLWQTYQEEKDRIRRDLYGSPSSIGIENPLEDVKWHSRNEKIHVIDPRVAECFLFHGTSPNTVKLIARNGFTTQYKKKARLTGYGALGKGIYLSDAFSKSATYVSCVKCQKQACDCDSIKMILLSRAVLGKIYCDSNRNRKFEEGCPASFHSTWGPFKEFLNKSVFWKTFKGFSCNEFCVPEKQVYPEFCIIYKENYRALPTDEPPSDSLLPGKVKWEDKKCKLKRFGFENFNDLKSIKEIDIQLDGYGRQCMFSHETRQVNFLIFHLKPILDSALEQAIREDRDIRCIAILEDLKNSCDKEIELKTNRYRSIDNYPLEFENEVRAGVLFRNKNWIILIPCLEKLIEKQRNTDLIVELLIMRAIAYRNIKQPEIYFKNVIHAYQLCINHKVPRSPRVDHEFDCFYSLFAKYALSNINNRQADFDEIFRVFADMLANKLVRREIDFYDWEYFFYSFSRANNTHRDILLDSLKSKAESNERMKSPLYKKRINELCNHSGLTNATAEKTRLEILYQTINQVSTSRKSDVMISWLEIDSNDCYQVKNAYLTEKHINVLFCAKKGYPKLNNRQKQGSCLVKALQDDQNKVLAFLKLYPDYPLRQLVFDEFCRQISGNSLNATIVKLTHSKRPNKPYPALISQAMSFSLPSDSTEHRFHTLHDCYVAGLISKAENLFDNYYFGLKFFETYLLQPRDEKADNLSLVAIIDNDEKNNKTTKFALVGIDSDLCLGFKNEKIIDQPHVYSIIYLSKHMTGELDARCVRKFMNLEFAQVLKTCEKSITQYAGQLIGEDANRFLFTKKEAEYIEILKNKMGDYGSFFSSEESKYSLSCHLSDCFSDSELLFLYDRFDKLAKMLKKLEDEVSSKISKSLWELDVTIHKLINTSITHMELLEFLDECDHKDYYYVNCFNQDLSLIEKFSKLNGIKSNFKLLSNKRLQSIKPRPSGVFDLKSMFTMKQRFYSIESYTKLSEQFDLVMNYHESHIKLVELDESYDVETTVSYQKPLSGAILSQLLHSNTNEIKQSLWIFFKGMTSLVLDNCDEVTGQNLSSRIKHLKLLKNLTINGCRNFEINGSPITYLRHLDVVLLSKLNVIDLNVDGLPKFLYLSKLDQLKKLRIVQTSNNICSYVKKVDISSCKCLESIRLDVGEQKIKLYLNDGYSNIQQIDGDFPSNVIISRFELPQENLILELNGVYMEIIKNYNSYNDWLNEPFVSFIETSEEIETVISFHRSWILLGNAYSAALSSHFADKVGLIKKFISTFIVNKVPKYSHLKLMNAIFNLNFLCSQEEITNKFTSIEEAISEELALTGI